MTLESTLRNLLAQKECEWIDAFLRQQCRSRLRLTSPYREHLSQASARFFMRVGLPSSVSKTW